MKHYNPTIAEDATRILNLKNGDMMPEEIEGIVAVIPITPKANIVRGDSAVNTATITPYTTPTDKDFYLTSIQFSIIKDVTNQATYYRINGTIEGVSKRIAQIQCITLTPQYSNGHITFNPPIKLDRGTNVQGVVDSAVANVSISLSLTGYTVETTKGV